MAFLEKSVWASNNRYYIDGDTIAINNSLYKKQPIEVIIQQLEKYKPQNNYDYFNRFIDDFIRANQYRLDYLIEEAHEFIKNSAKDYPRENIVLSFSG